MNVSADFFCIFSICLPISCRDCGAFDIPLCQDSDKVKDWVSWASGSCLHFCMMLFGDQVEGFRQVPELRRQNVLSIVPIFTIDNNHYLSFGIIILAWLADYGIWTLFVKMGGNQKILNT